MTLILSQILIQINHMDCHSISNLTIFYPVVCRDVKLSHSIRRVQLEGIREKMDIRGTFRPKGQQVTATREMHCTILSCMVSILHQILTELKNQED